MRRRTTYTLFSYRTKQRDVVKCVAVAAFILFFTFVFRDERDLVGVHSEKDQHVLSHEDDDDDICSIATRNQPPFGENTRDDLESEKGREYFALQRSRQFYIPRKFVVKPVIKRGASVIILICSSHGRQGFREAIRDTWAGDVGDETGIVFIVGNGDTALIEEEIYLNRDILQVSTDDSYGNLVLKVLAGLQWVNDNFQDAKYITKIDDDEYLNVKLLQNLAGKDCLTKNRIFGIYLHKSEVLREAAHKWFVPHELYPFASFPPYVTGGFYLMERGSLARLLDVVEFLPIVPLEDVFITGIAARIIGLGHANHTLVRHASRLPCNFALDLSVNNPDLTIDDIYFLHRNIRIAKRRFVHCHYI